MLPIRCAGCPAPGPAIEVGTIPAVPGITNIGCPGYPCNWDNSVSDLRCLVVLEVSGCFWWCFSPGVAKRMAGDAGTSPVKAVGA